MSLLTSRLKDKDVATAAKTLLGWKIIRMFDGITMSGRIVETEGYHQNDAASHSYKHRTPRTEVMFGPPGFAYVYFTYGMHYCFNIVTGPPARGEAVLIRAIEPLEGIESMKTNRKRTELKDLTTGPAKLCQALAIDKSFTGHNLLKSPLLLEPGSLRAGETVVKTTRIGISLAKEEMLRFYIKNNSFVSKFAEVKKEVVTSK